MKDPRKKPTEPRAKDKLKALGVRATKERGQNFVIDESVIDSIMTFGAPGPEERLLEIGPGLGALTKRLAQVGELTVIEIEDQFCREIAADFPNVTVICSDVRAVNLSGIKGVGEKFTVFGNLPYAFSTDIVFLLIEHASALKKATLLLQREFAERLAAPPGGRDFGRLSIGAQLAADITLGPVIAGTAFHPPASVQSRLVTMFFLDKPRFAIEDRAWFDKVVKGAFLQRRKKLPNSFKAAGFATLSQIERGLLNAQIDPGRRAETLSIQEFVTLSECLKAEIKQN